MEMLLHQISLIGHAVAAALFAALAIWQFQRKTERNGAHISLVAALSLTSFWALSVSVEGPFSSIANFSESVRNLGWLTFMFVLLQSGEGRDEPKTIKLIYAALAFVLLGQIVVDALVPIFEGSPRLGGMALYTALVLRMIYAIGALVLVHNLYSISAPETRWGIRLPMASLAAIWTYDLNLFTITYLTQQFPAELDGYAWTGYGLYRARSLHWHAVRNTEWRLKLSRSVAFRSLVACGHRWISVDDDYHCNGIADHWWRLRAAGADQLSCSALPSRQYAPAAVRKIPCLVQG